MPNITPKTTGWHDDGTESGDMRVHPVRGNAVFVPYEANESTISVNNSIYGKNYTQDLANGKGMKVVSASSATLANPCELDLWFNGNIFGLVYECTVGTPANAQPSIMIDGIAYACDTFPKADRFTRNGTVLHPRISGTPVSWDLGDGPHYAEIMFPNSVTETRNWLVYGYLLDSREGYLPLQRGGVINTTQKAIPTGSYVDLTIDTTTSANGAGAKSIRKIHFLNITGTAATVTLSNVNGAGGNFWEQSVPANSSVDWDPGLNIFNPSYLYATAGTGSAIVAAIVESY